MSNYPPPQPFSGPFYSPGQPPYHHPPPTNSSYSGTYQPQYLQQPSHRPQYPPVPPNAQTAQYANNAAFGQNQYQQFIPPPQPPLLNLYNYAQYARGTNQQSILQGQSQAIHSNFPMTGIMPGPGLEYSTARSFVPGPGAHQEPRATGTEPMMDGAMAQRPQMQASAPLDVTDEAIRRALATAGTNPADFPSLPPSQLVSGLSSHPKFSGHGDAFQTANGSGHDLPHIPGKGNMSMSSPRQQLPTLPGIPSPHEHLTQQSPSQDKPATTKAHEMLPYTLWQEKRKEAKKAVTEMLRAGITLDEISQEGIELQLLHELFPELALGSSSGKTAQRDMQSTRIPSLLHRSERSLESGEVSEGDGHYGSTNSNGVTQAIDPNQSTGQTRGTEEAPSPKQPSTAKLGDERKDYIARLLAAKKSIGTETSQSAAAPSDREAGTQNPKLAEPTSLEMIHATQNDEAIPKEPLKRREGKDPVQTELVKKRLLALKAARPSSIQIAGTRTSQSSLDQDLRSSKLTSSTDDHGSQILKQPRVGSDSESVMHPPVSTFIAPRTSNSFYAEGDDEEFAGLPGLSPILVKPHSQARVGHQQSYDGEDSAIIEQPHVDINTNPVATIVSSADSTHQIAPSPRLVTEASQTGHTPHTSTVLPSTRKRAMASDFLDTNSPPPLKRRAPSDGPIQVLIDVSEDEGEIKDNDMQAQESSTRAIIGGPLNERPPLSSFPSAESINRLREQPSTETPKRLTKLEAEMKAMKEKIAERQRNKRAMRAQELGESAADSTEASNSGFASPNVGVTSNIGNLGDVELKSKQQQQQRTLAASRSLLQEKLEAERRTHALITAHAENERRQAANATTDAERNSRLDRKVILEAAIPKLDGSIKATVQRLDTIRKQQDEVQEELERGQRERQALIEELNVLLSSETSMPAPEVLQEQDASNNVPPQDATALGRPALTAERRIHGGGESSAPSSADLQEITRHSPVTVSSHAESGEDLLEEAMDISNPSDDEDRQSTHDRSELDSLFDVKPRDVKLDRLQAGGEIPSTGETSRDEVHEVHDDVGDGYELSLDEQFSDDDNGDDVDPDPRRAPQDMYPDSRESSSHSSDRAEFEDYGNDMGASYQPELAEESVHTGPSNDPSLAVEKRFADQEKVSYNNEPSRVSPVVPRRVSEEGELSDDELSSDDYEPPEPADDMEIRLDVPTSISQNGQQAFGLAEEASEGPGLDTVVGADGATQLEVSDVEGYGEDRYH